MNIQQEAFRALTPDDQVDGYSVIQLLQAYSRGKRDFSRISLPVVELRDRCCNGQQLSQINLAQSRLIWTSWRQAIVIEADFAQALLWRADFTDAVAIGANFHRAIAICSQFTTADLHRADFTGADLRLANLAGADLSQANLAGADLRYANLAGANLTGANLSHVRLDGADLTDADFYHAQFWQPLPDRTRSAEDPHSTADRRRSAASTACC